MKFYVHLLISLFILSSNLIHTLTDAETFAMIETQKAQLIDMGKSSNEKGNVRSRKVSFSGTMDIANSVGEQMQLCGKGTLENCKITESTTLDGEYIITDSSLGKVYLKGLFCSFNNCMIASINVKGAENEICIIELLNTIVEGEIVFEGTAGIIVVNDKTLIKHPVVNATIIKK